MGVQVGGCTTGKGRASGALFYLLGVHVVGMAALPLAAVVSVGM